MLTVTIKNGDADSREFWVNDLGDLKNVQSAITDEFQKVLEQEKSEDRIELERVLDTSPCDTSDELIDFLKDVADVCDGCIERFKDIAEMNRQLCASDYDSVEEMMEDINNMKESLRDIYYSAGDWV